MKSKDHVKKLREMSADDLNAQVKDMREQTFKLRFQMAMGQTESLKRMRELRKENARVQTILREQAKGR